MGDAASLARWVGDCLQKGAGRSDLIVLRHAHRAAGDAGALGQLVEIALANCATAERRAESVGQGNAFARAASAWEPSLLAALRACCGDLPYSVAVGALGGVMGVAEDNLAAAFAHNYAANLISAAVRLVPLGQSAGLSVLAGLETLLLALVQQSADLTLDDIGGFAMRAEIASARHETQTTRLFRS